ncbi:hypothetical protein [Streptococcus pseudopneumoniae]
MELENLPREIVRECQDLVAEVALVVPMARQRGNVVENPLPNLDESADKK